MDRLFRASRIFRTGLAFGTFGLGACVLTLLIVPIVRWRSRSRADTDLRVQVVVHRSFGAFVRWMERLKLIVVEFEGEQPGGSEPVVVVANHPTLIDVVLLVSRLPQADCVVKKGAWTNPFLRAMVSAAGYVPNDGGVDLIETCVERIRGGRSLLLFPEGTRSPHGSLGPFRRGAVHVALRADCPLQRVVIRCEPPVLSKEVAWWSVPDRTPVYRIETHPPKRLDRTDLSPSRTAREATQAMREWFLKQLSQERWSHVGS